MDYQLSAEEKQEIQQTFRLIDTNGDGKLSIAEIKRSAQKLGCNPTTDDVKEMIKSIDADGNTYVTYQEYEEMMRQQLMSLAYEKEVCRTPICRNTYVTYQEYEEMMRQQLMSLAYEKEVLMRAFQKFDKDGSGNIDASELKHALKNYGEDKLTEAEVLEFFEDFDTNDDGKINIEEFIQAFCMDENAYSNSQYST